MNRVVEKNRPRARTASKEERRTQLIRATVRSIARYGLSVTTMATVTKEAGLSQGIINLHFQSKDRLLVETLRYIADEYKEAWEAGLARGGESSAARLKALVEVDFDRKVCQRNKLAVWFAFWGETRSRPTYRKICAERDVEYLKVLIELCSDVIREGAYASVNAESVAYGLSAMSEGLWLDLLLTPESMSPEQARGICMAYLGGVFPRHFTN